MHSAIFTDSLLMILDFQLNTCYFAVYKPYQIIEMVIALLCA